MFHLELNEEKMDQTNGRANTGPRKTTGHQSTGHQPSGHQPTSPLYPRPHDPENESPPMSSCVKKDEHSEFLPANRVVSPADDPMTLGQAQPIDTAAAATKGKEKAWKEAEDAGMGTNVNPARRLQQNFHLDLATGGLTDEAEDEEQNLLESPGSGLHRISSESTFQQSDLDSNRQHDPYRMLERSQSDASLLKRDLELLPDNDEVHLTAAESSSVQNISECNRVYLDLSRAEAFERVELGETSGSMMRTASGRLLETIPQDEELKTGDLSYVYATHRSFSQESSSSMEDLTFCSKSKSKEKFKACGKSASVSSTSVSDSNSLSSKSNLRSSFQIYSHSLKQKVRQLQMGSIPEQLNALTELNVLMEQAWSMPIYGKDLAYELCDILRTESALDIIVSNLASSNRELMKASARLLEQSLTTSNRRQVSENGLELVVKMTHDARGDCELAQTCTGILESLFKTSEDTCAKVIKLGGLDTITYWCRCNDRVTLKNCAIALSNLALYGGGENQQEMAKHKVPEWLFPLAFVEDDSVRYYALLAIGVLVSNKEIENAVISSGTLALVLPFIDSHDPAEFAERDMSHRHGRSPGWLKRLIPVLFSKREEAQALAAFHFVMEAGIKSEQGRKEVLYKIEAVEPLKWLASTPNRVASKLAAQALKIIGEEVPHKLSQQVPLWTCDDVVHWIAQVGFSSYSDSFQRCQVDGDLLLRLTEEELMESINMTCAITRKRFLRELRDLKISSDYTSCDPSMLGAWLRDVSEDMSQYTYQMLYTGVDRPLLRSVKDSHLSHDCKIVNGIHRMKILSKIEELRSTLTSPASAPYDSVDALSSSGVHKPPIDVFISYRRSNGSQLASLLKVHLQLRGFTVFIDIERLRAGKFDESLLESVKQAKNFIIVLTPNSLDRCMGDTEKKDWVHREITAAIEAGSNIIPLLDNFKWPAPDSLPEDMRNVCYFNAVRWIHDYQDACVDKLEQFLRGEVNPQQRVPAGPSSTHSSNNTTSVPRQSTTAFESPNSPPYQRAQGLSKTASIDSPGES
ncbi:NAD(+) hydrolase SARM1-like isoform X3 [Physella acuta]|uniref:NAD(+) hydrolase SARM1-like isoform X3 n=1 Tax=Physella acuta TaxID=109671 RepID=UPI0027DC7839|nr:NAD(+) hydrolase SARM1-like isoform X3 [Physella acuta]